LVKKLVEVHDNMAIEKNEFTSSRGFTFDYEGEFGGTPITLEENQEYSWSPFSGFEDSTSTDDDPEEVGFKPLMRPTAKPERPTKRPTNKGFGSDTLGEFGDAGGLGSRPRIVDTLVDDSPPAVFTSKYSGYGDDYEPVDFLKQAGITIINSLKDIGTVAIDKISSEKDIPTDNVSEVASEYSVSPFPFNSFLDSNKKIPFKNVLEQFKDIFSYKPIDKNKNIDETIEEVFPDIRVYPNYFSGGVPIVSSNDLIEEPISTNWDSFFEFMDAENVAQNFDSIPKNTPINIEQFELLQTPIKNSNYYDKEYAKEEDKGVFDMDLDKIFDLLQKRNEARRRETVNLESLD
tara:strand:+ start:3627 stop:4667 length:1041 start_codon:yes stop_codon:yes gene_type:complete